MCAIDEKEKNNGKLSVNKISNRNDISIIIVSVVHVALLPQLDGVVVVAWHLKVKLVRKSESKLLILHLVQSYSSRPVVSIVPSQ